MSSVSRSITLPGSIERAWDTLVDFSSMHEWFFGVAGVSLCEPERELAEGSERILKLVYGVSHKERVGQLEEGKFFTIIVLDPPPFVRSWTGRIALESTDAGPSLEWQMHWEPRFGAPGAFFDRLLVRPVIDLALRRSLANLAKRLGGAG
jgi:hypothetical protein